MKQRVSQSIAVKTAMLDDEKFWNRVQQVVDTMVDALSHGHRVLFCGNGGSAADAQHLAAELSGRFYLDRTPLAAEALHCNSSFMTAVANDYGYDQVYARMVEASATEGDVLVGISTSGNSGNVLEAFKAARRKNVTCIALTGATGGAMKAMCDVLLNVPSSDTPRIQEAHILVGHIICEQVEARIFPSK